MNKGEYMSEQGMTYKESGVDILKEVSGIKALAGQLGFKRTGIGAPAELGGHFTGLVEFGDDYLSMCTDGVGSKIMIADRVRRWDTVGIDCIAMNSNDMICIGAEPIALVDYIAIDDPEPELLGEIAKGLNKGAEESNATIIGGETASLPDIVNGFDVAATCLGFVKKDRLIGGDKVEEGNILIGLPSTGIHSNGFSLVRKVIDASKFDYDSKFSDVCSASGVAAGSQADMTLGEVCLVPTRIYVRPIMELINKVTVHGLVHVTGGGLKNLPRINGTVDYLVEEPLEVPPIFKVVQHLGGVEDREMYQTFNMGMGFLVVVPGPEAERALEVLQAHYSEAAIVGRTITGSGLAKHVPLGLEYDSL